MLLKSVIKIATVESPVSGHPWDAEKVSITEAGCLQEYLNAEVV